MSSSDTNYVPNEHEDADQYDSYAVPSKIMPYQSYPKKFGESKWNPYWVTMLTSSSVTDYVPNEHEGVDQYGSFSIPS